MSDSSGFNQLCTDCSTLCYQYCNLKEFVSLFCSSKYWYSIVVHHKESWRYLTFVENWLALFEKYQTRIAALETLSFDLPSTFLLRNPLFKNVGQLKLVDNGEPDVNRLLRWSQLCFLLLHVRYLNVDTPCEGRHYHYFSDLLLNPLTTTFQKSLEIIKVQCNMYVVSMSQLNTQNFPKLHTLHLKVCEFSSDVPKVKNSFSHLQQLKHLLLYTVTDPTTFTVSDDYFIAIFTVLPNLQSFSSNQFITSNGLAALNLLLPPDFALETHLPQLITDHSPLPWLKQFHTILLLNPARQLNWRFNATHQSRDLILLLLKEFPLLLCKLEIELTEAPLELWKQCGQCKLLTKIKIEFTKPYNLTIENIRALQPIYSKLQYFSLSNIVLSMKKLLEIEKEIQDNMIHLTNSEIFDNLKILSPFRAAVSGLLGRI